MTDGGSHAQQWHTKATTRAQQGELDEMVSNELFDHTWKSALHALDRQLHFKDGQTVLDAGCGWGRLLLGLKYFHPGVQADGIELTTEFTEKARALLERHGLSQGTNVTQGDLLEVDLGSDRYDSIYSSRVLHYIDDKELVIRKFHAALRPGGQAMVIIPNRDSPYQRRVYKHAPLFPIHSMGEIMCKAGFRDLRYGGYRMLPAGGKFAHDSTVAKLETALSSSPLGRFGGLAYVVGRR
jgi:cyclopropane fatty-acyl-phospholipid synthase-like methyltransferase